MDETKLIKIKDGEQMRSSLTEAPPVIEKQELPTLGETVKKKRRRGKSKRKIMKPFMKIPWQNRRKNDNCKRNNRFRKIVLATTHAPFNNNQFLMEIHKPEPENSFHMSQTPGRNRDSSFSVDSEDNYLYSLPEDEEEYLTKEFSSVYEDVENEHLSNMTKNELVQEYLLLKSKYENLIKRSEVSKLKQPEDVRDTEGNDVLVSDKDSVVTDRDTSGTSFGSSSMDETSFGDMLLRLKEQEDQIRELQMSNEKLKLENEHLRKRQHDTSSEDSESDSTSTSNSDSNSSSSESVMNEPAQEIQELPNANVSANGHYESEEVENTSCMMNGFHDPSD